jgi:hypothetical protein
MYDLEIAFWMQIKSWREGAAIKLRPRHRFVRLQTRHNSISTAKLKLHADTVNLVHKRGTQSGHVQ